MNTKMKKGLILGLAGASLLVLMVVSAIILTGTKEPPKAEDPSKQLAVEKKNYVLSEQFAQLPMEEKKKYLQEAMKDVNPREFFHQDEATREKMRETIQPVFEAIMQERAEQYFALKTPEEKVAYLDKMIDERAERFKKMAENMQEMTDEQRAEMRKRFEEHRRNRGSGPSLDRIKSRIESTDPKARAEMTQFHLAMRERMKQRGVPTGPGGGHGGWRGGGGH